MSEIHEIRVQGRLDDRWVDWLAVRALTRENDGTTTLTGPLADQAALHGVLNTIRDLNLPIVSVRRVYPDADRPIRSTRFFSTSTPHKLPRVSGTSTSRCPLSKSPCRPVSRMRTGHPASWRSGASTNQR